MDYSGFFVTLEGLDGCGKSTQAALLRARLESCGFQTLHTVEPGGTPVGQRIRALFLDPSSPEMCRMTEILLMAADRAQHVEQTIKPALDAGSIVICERFVDSSIAYQGYGWSEDIVEVRRINEIATQGLKPDLTILLDLEVEEGMEHLNMREDPDDRIEKKGKAYLEKVRLGYLEIHKREPERVLRIVVSGRCKEDIHEEIFRSVESRLERKKVSIKKRDRA